MSVTRRRSSLGPGLGALMLLWAWPAGAEGLTATYLQSGTYDAAARELSLEFAKQTGTAVNIVALPWAALRQSNAADLTSGAGRYQVMSGGWYLADLYGYFAPLTEYIARDNYAEGMIAGLMLPGRSEWFDGEQIGIPYGIDAYGLLANDEILRAAGIAPDLATWPDVIQACVAIEAKLRGIACLAHPTGNPEQIGALFFGAYDGSFVDAHDRYRLEPAKAVAAAKLLPQLFAHLPDGGQALSFDQSLTLFADGRAAFLVDWPSFVTDALDDPARSKVSGHWRQLPFPGPGFPRLSLWQEFIPRATADKDAAWAWIKTFAGPDHARSNYVLHNINPVWRAVYDDPELKRRHAHHWPAMLLDFARARNPPLSAEAEDILAGALAEAATGRAAPEAAIAKVNQAWSALPVPPALLEAATGAGFKAQSEARLMAPRHN